MHLNVLVKPPLRLRWITWYVCITLKWRVHMCMLKFKGRSRRFNPETGELCFVTILQSSDRETKMILSLWIEFCWPVLFVNVTTAQSDLGNFKCHIQSALSPQSITACSTAILFAGPSAEVILNRWNTVQVIDTKQKERVKKEKGAGGIWGWNSLESCGKCQRDTFCWNTGCAEWWENGFSSV